MGKRNPPLVRELESLLLPDYTRQTSFWIYLIDFHGGLAMVNWLNKFLTFRKPSSFARTESNHHLMRSEQLEERIMLSSVQIHAAGETGMEELRLFVKDQQVASWSQVAGDATNGDFIEFSYESVQTISAEDVTIRFSNDLYDPANGIDRNLAVDRIVIDGQTFQTDSDDVFSYGTFNGPDIISGLGLGSTLYANGRFEFGSSAGSVLTVRAMGELAEEEFLVLVDNEAVGRFTTSQNSELASYQVFLNQTINPGDVRVEFTNDLYQPELDIDRNLVVDWIEIDGQRFQTEAPEVYSTGFVSGQQIVFGFWQNETLYANGSFSYSNADVDLTAPTIQLGPTNNITENRVNTVEISLRVSDDFEVRFQDIANDALVIISPDGTPTDARQIAGSQNPDGSKTVFFQFNNPNGFFTESQNGTYSVTVKENSISDVVGNFVPAGLIGTFQVSVTDPVGTDVTPPTAMLQTSVVSDATFGFNFTVEFRDETELGFIDIDSSIQVFGPNGYSQSAYVVGGGGFGDTLRTFTYQTPPTGGPWSPDDNGTYEIYLDFETVFDFAGNSALGGTLGTIQLQL